jgi:hypothetical protein
MIWRNNKKDWMTAATMEKWLNMFNANMKKKNRNAILFLDSATCHHKVTLSNVKISWFPVNATSTRVVRKIRLPMIFHNEKHVYWH